MTPAPSASARPEASLRYEDAVRRYAAERLPEARTSRILSRLRLLTFLPGAACAVFAPTRGPIVPLLIAAALFLVIFAGLVVWHARVEDRMAWLDALSLVNRRGAARIRRDWDHMPAGEPPAGLAPGALERHPYAGDLDLFGRASLFQWLGPAATAMGARRLAEWLLTPASPDEIEVRQEAVAALAPLDQWRERLAAHGVISATARHEDIDRFLEWAEGPPLLGGWQRALQVTVLIITASIWLLLALFAVGTVEAALWLIPVVFGLVLWFAWSWRIHKWLDRAGGGQRALARYGHVLEHAVLAPRSGAALSTILDRLTTHGRRAPDCMRSLNRILGFGELRRSPGIFHFPIEALTLWDFHVVFALERWRAEAGPHVREWLEAMADLDALALMAGVRRDNADWCQPTIVTELATRDAVVLDAASLGHPLLADNKRITNDVRVGPPATLLLVTGSNMSGKSTLLRAIGLNIVLAQAGSVVAATRLSLPPSDLQTSLRVQDSLELGLSYFMAALARLKGVVDAAEHERPGRLLVYLLDEILQGTNSVERALAVRAVARHLLEAGAIGVMTTHDLSLAEQEPLASAAELVHFTEHVNDNGEMGFDYRLRPGLATSRNALRLMKLIGIDL
jgi:predicted ATPase